MKKFINRNILWSELFTNTLQTLGVENACISPGSRSTPLVFALDKCEKIKKHIIIDERSSGFFALGLSIRTGKPTILLTTSGTAAAELYPAIIEAYQKNIPLIICTADRSFEDIDTGSNQSINQHNLYANHIIKFIDAGLPEINQLRLNQIVRIARQAYYHSMLHKGPVHINFRFRKPFEPESFTDELDLELSQLSAASEDEPLQFPSKQFSVSAYHAIADKVNLLKTGLILCGNGNFTKEEEEGILSFSEKTGFPIFADGLSPLRFHRHNSAHVFVNQTAFLRSSEFVRNFVPEIIFNFGAPPTSNIVLEYLSAKKAYKVFIGEFSSVKDPSHSYNEFFDVSPSVFYNGISDFLNRSNYQFPGSNKNYFFLQKVETICDNLKKSVFGNAEFPFEGKLIDTFLDFLPENSSIFLSNSMPVREFDFFAAIKNKKISVFSNRGASGIDGIISTAAGISVAYGEKVYLITGDLAFLYDLNALQLLNLYKIPLTIILLNNNGGGIFRNLPVSEYDIFEKYFVTPQNLEFSLHAKAFNLKYHNPQSWEDFFVVLSEEKDRWLPSVIEIKSDSRVSTVIRNRYWRECVIRIDEHTHWVV
ncbi:MAG: 2-succinyl-5-enolpyruvyl-6-hydroxy-3-cyclohexene-1-carboxylic-acid synthase [Ignavibacteriales bacterium]|nr:2-succinyl-5-enolpyruvyl-6-hydroxy-3-cyclohexene-1-carboxylic-acid synthase [Ignavibacteriales bacterium]MCF8435793.1 2-succinyl-5-enolpyruvyl-6-hydroxy-3-cyclohexene-1-carboxylic-acid synthase [Ignavibacteriales bacterium]